MPALTLAEKEANLVAANNAYKRALNAQSYTEAGKSKTNVDVQVALDSVNHWEAEVIRHIKSGASGGPSGIVPQYPTPTDT